METKHAGRFSTGVATFAKAIACASQSCVSCCCTSSTTSSWWQSQLRTQECHQEGQHKHVEMETCRDCNMILRKVRRDATAVQGQLPGPNTAQQDACPHPRISMAINGATRARHAARWPLGTIPIQVHMQPEKLLVQLLHRPNHLGTSTWTKWRRSSRPVWSLQE